MLVWPAICLALNTIANLQSTDKRKIKGTKSNSVEMLAAAIKETMACLTPEESHNLITLMLHFNDAKSHVKSIVSVYTKQYICIHFTWQTY